MDTKKLILIRHGESVSNKSQTLTGRTESELTRKGRMHSKKSSIFIKKRYSAIDAIYSSPLKRASATARIISKKVNAPVHLDELLVETDFGIWEGQGIDDLYLKPDWDTYISDPFHFSFPDGESQQDVKKRILEFKDRLLTNKDWKNIIIVSHYTPISFLILSVIGDSNDKHPPFRIDNASISVIEIAEDFEFIGMLNYTP